MRLPNPTTLRGSGMNRILITGSRDWTDKDAVIDAIMDLNNWYPIDWDEVVIVHGDCPTGADKIADDWAKATGIETDPHPANWELFGKAAGPKRNKEMVDLGADIVLAFPKGKSAGTRGCIKLAQEAGLPVKIFEG